jgi:Holliday junction resolvasome RuvABC endonuclease subunit
MFKLCASERIEEVSPIGEAKSNMNVITLDMNTKYIAYALFVDGRYTESGRVVFSGDGDCRIGAACSQIIERFAHTVIDVVVYESAFLGKNVVTLKELSKVTGAVISGFYQLGALHFYSVAPITWQLSIGVGKTSAPGHLDLRGRYPDKSTTWLKNKDRENRKQLIINYVNERFGTDHTMATNDEADAMGVGCYAMKKWPELFGSQ